MNKNQISELCNQLSLGSPVKNISPVTGGLLHQMWKLETTQGTYAVKQLSKDIPLTTKIKKSYELTEQIADQFKQSGIPAVSALNIKGHHLIEIGNTGFLVYPWLDAKALDKDVISEEHALKIASLIAKMHLLNLDLPEMDNPEFDIHTDDKIIQLIHDAMTNHCPFASNLKENQDRIIAINQCYQNAIVLLKAHTVVSHGDLDQKNVLWDQDGNPTLIDWESARKLNPTYEIINAALDWSGITTENFNRVLFPKILQAYIDAGAKIEQKLLQAALYGVCGNWINWMVYNIKRACNSDPNESAQRKIGVEQVELVIATILRVEELV